jgi:hypothetical protein
VRRFTANFTIVRKVDGAIIRRTDTSTNYTDEQIILVPLTNLPEEPPSRFIRSVSTVSAPDLLGTHVLPSTSLSRSLDLDRDRQFCSLLFFLLRSSFVRLRSSSRLLYLSFLRRFDFFLCLLRS